MAAMIMIKAAADRTRLRYGCFAMEGTAVDDDDVALGVAGVANAAHNSHAV